VQGSGFLVAVAFSCARFAVVLQILGDSVRVTVGNAFTFCIRALACIALSNIVVATVAVAFVVLVMHEGGDQCGVSASVIAAFADSVIGARAGRTGSGSGTWKVSSNDASSPCTTYLIAFALWYPFSCVVVFFSRS